MAQMVDTEDRTLWIGDLPAYMDASFLGEAFYKMGETVKNVKIIFDKYTGKPAGYAFIEVADTETARRCMLNINGKIVPDSKPPITFKLSFASGHSNPSNEFCLNVGNLPNEVDDALLFNVFGNRYVSCRGARVYRNPDGSSKGTGNVRFANETDQQTALVEMNRFALFGRPMSLRIAAPRSRQQKQPHGAMQYDPAMYYSSHFAGQFGGTRVQDFYSQGQMQFPPGIPPPNSLIRHSFAPASVVVPLVTPLMLAPVVDEENELELYSLDVGDIERENLRFMAQSEELYNAMEESNWFNINSASLHVDDL